MSQGLAKKFDVHPNQITQWKTQLIEQLSTVFEQRGSAKEPSIDIKTLHAKIGELALENDLLEGALTKAGLLSAKK
jgi:transposase-like protein